MLDVYSRETFWDKVICTFFQGGRKKGWGASPLIILKANG